MYAIVDIETTGGYAGKHKITEIAIYHHDGFTDAFVLSQCSLDLAELNPEAMYFHLVVQTPEEFNVSV